MDIARRDMLKAQAAAAAAAVANVPLQAGAQNIATGDELRLKWDKAPCRFCGTGCGVMVGVKTGASSPPMATCARRSIAASTA